jgi:tRNA threonylcarbamoyladenosine biosynthesis protein TsaB
VKLLAIESSSDRLSVALFVDGEVSEREGEPGAIHSGRVLPLVGGLLAAGHVTLVELDGIAFGAGPGAFTGLRLACGVAQGLAFGANLPVIGVGSLEALAFGAGAERVYACVDARMNEIYCAAYRIGEGRPDVVLAPSVVAPAAAPLPEGLDWLGCGSGFAAYAEILRARLGRTIARADGAARPRASAVARLAARRLARGEGADAAAAVPLYVRDRVALTVAERLASGGKA